MGMFRMKSSLVDNTINPALRRSTDRINASTERQRVARAERKAERAERKAARKAER